MGRKLVILAKSGNSIGMFCCRFACSLMVAILVLSDANAGEGSAWSDRSEIPARYKWDLTLFYENWESWEADLDRATAVYETLNTYRGRLGESPETLLEAMQLSDEGGMLFTKVFGYVALKRDVDTRDNDTQARFGQVMSAYSKVRARLSWMSPELLAIPEERMRSWVVENDGLAPYRFSLLDTYRTGQYTLSADGERLLSLHGKVRRVPGEVHSALTNADGERPEVELTSGERITITPGIYGKALNQFTDASDRRKVQEAWMAQYEERRNTFAAIYAGVLGQGWAEADSRGYASTIEMALTENAIPFEVIENLIRSARDGALHLQRYHAIRQQFMDLDEYGWSDMHIPLINDDSYYVYDDMVPLVIRSVGIFGEAYRSRMEEQFGDGLIDVFETPGKRSGAYNASRYGVGSFVLLNYHGTLEDVFTLAHEMGHSMHSRLSQEFQPFATHRYTIFVAEVAAILNEKLLLRELLKEEVDPRRRIAFLEHQIGGIVGTFFLQTMMADFELQAHSLLENGGGITADRLTDLWKETVTVYHGGVIPEDDPYMFSWGRIPHLYNSPFYVYQYATCYAASAYLMERLPSDAEAVSSYLELLKSGGNDHPMAQLRQAGVDMMEESVFEAVIEEFARLVDQLEVEYSAYLSLVRTGA
jgi:oligoendopeptidase F